MRLISIWVMIRCLRISLFFAEVYARLSAVRH